MNLPGALRDAPDAMRDKVPAALQPTPIGLPTDSPLRTDRMAAALGVALGVTFTICFLTGMLSHLIQDPPSWFLWPTRPINGYRFTQGLHVATGLATIPILLAKLWVVYPKLFRWPPATGLSDAVSRLSDLLLVGGGPVPPLQRDRQPHPLAALGLRVHLGPLLVGDAGLRRPVGPRRLPGGRHPPRAGGWRDRLPPARRRRDLRRRRTDD